MSNTVIAILIIVAVVIFFSCTVIGKRLRLRMEGAAKEKIAEDASTVDGAKAYYNTAIEKKEQTYKNAYAVYTQIVGERHNYEKQIRDFKKKRIPISNNINICLSKNDDEKAKVYLREQNEIDEKVQIIEEALTELRETEKIQKERLDDAFNELKSLKSEKDSAILKLQAANVTQDLKSISGTSDDETDKMLETVREGINKKVKQAEGSRIVYDNSADVQSKRLDKQMKEEDLDRQLEELKKRNNS